MIDNDNIKIFDEIFRCECDDDKDLNKLIKNYFNTTFKYCEFVKGNENLLKDANLLINETLDGYGIISNSFPKLNSEGLNLYYKFKKNQFLIKKQEKVVYNLENLPEDLGIENSKALRKIVDYLINEGELISNGNYVEKDITGGEDVLFNKLKINVKINSNMDSTPINYNHYHVDGNQTIINNIGKKSVLKNNDFSSRKIEKEKETWLDKLLSFIKSLFTKWR